MISLGSPRQAPKQIKPYDMSSAYEDDSKWQKYQSLDHGERSNKDLDFGWL